ncbi:transcription intermediary factor 1-alpha-like isoform X1 [Babylonia areolata]|uniref:transcription intermediary factor 1-alpha-like isoform X1 n=1 Tax=Babylonia areolata TaxID=304850 RepID=UPI003FCF024D
MLLPPGGVGALQTNFYVVDNLAATSSSPPRRLCDVCTDDREATHSCLQCQQRYCLPCRKNHDCFSLSRGHTVVSLTQEEEEGCGKGIPLSDKHKVEMCTKHLNQQLLASLHQVSG